jgi:hypothetical protein
LVRAIRARSRQYRELLLTDFLGILCPLPLPERYLP